MALSCIHTNQLINCCSDMSTIMFSDQSSIFFRIHFSGLKSSSDERSTRIHSVPRIVINHNIIDNMAKMKLTPQATQTDKTKQFIIAVDEALVTFEDEISSLSENTRECAYKNFITSYRDAMVLIWNLSRFANVNTVLDTMANKEFSELKVMKNKLREKPPQGTVVKEGIKIPTLEDFTKTMKINSPRETYQTPKLAVILVMSFRSWHLLARHTAKPLLESQSLQVKLNRIR